MSIYHFDGDVCAQVGFPAAVLLYNIQHWLNKNEANEKHFYDGRYWTYNSMSAFAKLYPFLTERQVRTGLQNLEDAGYIVTGNYNKDTRDRTKWYALGDRLHLTQKSNGSDTEVKCINETDSKHTDNKQIPPLSPTGEKPVSTKFEDWWKLLPAACRSRANKAKTQSMWKRKGCEAIADDITMKTKARFDRRSGDINWIKSHGKYVPGAHIILRDALWDGEWHNPIADIDIVALVATWNDLAASHPMLCAASADDDALFDAIERTVACLPDRLNNEDYEIYFTHIASKSAGFKQAWTLTGVLRPDFLQRALAELRGAA